MSNSVAPNGAQTPPPFWTREDENRVKTLHGLVTQLTLNAFRIAEMPHVKEASAAAIADFLDQAAHELLKESEQLRERLPFVTSIGGTVLRGSREEIDDILDGLDDDVIPPYEGGGS